MAANVERVRVLISGIEVSPEDILYVGVAPCSAGLYQLVTDVLVDADC